MVIKYYSITYLIIILVIGATSNVSGCKNFKPSDNQQLIYQGNFLEAEFSDDKSKILYLKTIKIKGTLYYQKDQLWYKDLETSDEKLLYEIKNYDSREKPSNDIESFTWHPDNNTATLIVNTFYEFKTVSKFIAINTKTRKVKQIVIPKLKFLENERNNELIWSSDGKKLAIQASLNGSPIIIYDFQKEKINKITSSLNEYGMESLASLGTWSPDSNKITLTVKDNQYAPGELWIKDLSGGSLKNIISNSKAETSYNALAWSPDGEWLLIRYKALPKTEKDFFYNLASKKVYKVKLPANLQRGQILGWKDNVENLFIVNKEELWQVYFTKLQKTKVDLD